MKKYKVFGIPWHLGHQAELMKMPFIEWHWLIQYKRKYSKNVRGEFPVKWVTHYEPGKYDFAVLHLDQQCLDPGILSRGKGRVYDELNKVIQDIPKIVIEHGTPYWPEMFEPDHLIEKTRQLIGDNYPIVNSFRAAEQWGFGTPIIHGLDPDEWWDLPKEPRVVTMISPGGLPKYYDRQFLDAIRDELNERGITFCQISVDFQSKDFDDYRNFLGRSLIYINPTKESPMPRSRTEAMFSGCCVLTTPHQDADSFIEDGVNGFIIPRDPIAVADKVEELLNDYHRAVEIGQRGKQTARERFHMERFQREWLAFVEKSLADWQSKKNGGTQ